jgi:superfamily I DNA and RNA helicase
VDSALTVVRGTNDKPVASAELVNLLGTLPQETGSLFIGYPILTSAEGRHPIDALLVSPRRGIVVFDLIEGIDPGDFGARQDDAANKVEARLKTHAGLMRRRELLVPITPLSFAPGLPDTRAYGDPVYPLANSASLVERLRSMRWQDSDRAVFEAALSAIQNVSTIRRARTKRQVSEPNSRGAKLKRLEGSIATLDSLQSKAVIETAEGVQRIRGLAGSGKTIVLALKAAYLHAQHPDWRIGITFNTRSLKAQIRRLITSFSLAQLGEEPDWNNLRILTAWGAPGEEARDGVYCEFCRAHDIGYLDFGAARRTYRGSSKAFAGACERALEEMRARKPLYQALLVDEAQDLPSSFLRLCYEMLDDERRLVYAYDELQDLQGEALPPVDEIFGVGADGRPRVNFYSSGPGAPRQDIILEKCYRNSRPVLVTAHAFGFGIYRRPGGDSGSGLVQMFDEPQLWEEIGYQVTGGELREGAEVSLSRTEATSPRFLEEHSPIEDIVQLIAFDSAEEQAAWLVDAIRVNLEMDELRHDDIVVINPDPLTTQRNVGTIRRRLLDLGINSHLAGVDTDPDIFFKPEAASVTFSGVFRSKGNEAGMVYIINAQDCHSAAKNLSTIRNRPRRKNRRTPSLPIWQTAGCAAKT